MIYDTTSIFNSAEKINRISRLGVVPVELRYGVGLFIEQLSVAIQKKAALSSCSMTAVILSRKGSAHPLAPSAEQLWQFIWLTLSEPPLLFKYRNELELLNSPDELRRRGAVSRAAQYLASQDELSGESGHYQLGLQRLATTEAVIFNTRKLFVRLMAVVCFPGCPSLHYALPLTKDEDFLAALLAYHLGP